MNPRNIEVSLDYATADWLLYILEDNIDTTTTSRVDIGNLIEDIKDAISYQYPYGDDPGENFRIGYKIAAFKYDTNKSGDVFTRHAQEAAQAWNDMQESQVNAK